MAKRDFPKEAPKAGFDNPDEITYVASLKDSGGKEIAHITLRAEDDDDARQQLQRAKPSYFEGVGEWSLVKMFNQEIKA